MPELPEVETVISHLKTVVLNKKITNVNLFHKTIFNGNEIDLSNALVNNEIIDIERYGKYIVFILKDKYNLIAHLRMEGKFHVRNFSDLKQKHEHLFINFNDGTNLRYDDTRKFGRFDLRLKEEYLKIDPLAKLGLEPKDMKDGHLFSVLNKKKKPIKTAILDQTVIAGIGNIYADEVLFKAKVHPTRLANLVTLKEANLITRSAMVIFEEAIKKGGTTIKSFSATDIDGSYQDYLMIHTKENEPCPICGTKIIKIKVGGRGTYVCENCQK